MSDPKINEALDMGHGVFHIQVIRDGKNGPEVIAERRVANMVLPGGKKELLRRAMNVSTVGEFTTSGIRYFDQMRIGTSGITNSTAFTNVRSPVTGTLNTVDTKSLLAGTRTMQLVISYPSCASSKHATGIAEVAILCKNTSPGGTALARGIFAAVNKTIVDKLKITYSCRIT